MTHNDVLRSLRYLLNANNRQMAEILTLAGAVPAHFENFFKPEEDPQHVACDDVTLSHFLDGLIYFRRGKDESRPPQPLELPVTNNLILKKLRVAFELKEPDMHEIFALGDFRLGRSELSAFMRRKGQPNYRECGDQVLRYFLKGLTAKFHK